MALEPTGPPAAPPTTDGADAPLCALCREQPGVVRERWGEPLLCATCFIAVKGHTAP
jgi:hypothetical protein